MLIYLFYSLIAICAAALQACVDLHDASLAFAGQFIAAKRHSLALVTR